MIFVDTNVLVYAVGRSHPLKTEARKFFEELLRSRTEQLCTSVEVLQELLHIYLPVARLSTLDAAWVLVESCVDVIWPVELEDVRFARVLVDRYPELRARDLLHLACCRRREVERIKTFDRALAAAFKKS